jgi:hypothetical protein
LCLDGRGGDLAGPARRRRKQQQDRSAAHGSTSRTTPTVATPCGFRRHRIRSLMTVIRGDGFADGRQAVQRSQRQRGGSMAKAFLIVGFLALAIGLLWIGQGTGAVAWPRSSFMINQLQWAGYGAVLGAIGLMLIWQSKGGR